MPKPFNDTMVTLVHHVFFYGLLPPTFPRQPVFADEPALHKIRVVSKEVKRYLT